MKIFRKICVSLLLGVMAIQFVLADEIDKCIKDLMEAKKTAQINEDLIKAIEDRDLAKVKQLIKLGADVNARASYDDNTALGRAVSTVYDNNIEIVKYLISKGADINAKIDHRSERSILESVFRQQFLESYKLNVAKYLILQGADIGNGVLSDFLINENTWQSNKISYNDIIDMVKLLVSKGVNLNNDSFYDSDYLDDVLIFSRKHKKDKSQKLLKYLIKAGANPNVCPNRHSNTLLGLALEDTVSSVSWATHKICPNRHSNTLLGLALEDTVSSVSWATHKNGRATMVTLEKQVETDDVAQWLIDNGADVNLNCGGGYTALTVVSSKGNLNAVKWLVSKGAKDIDNALKEALASKHYDVAEFLMEKGAKKE